MKKTFSIITLFPELVEPYANSSILGRAQRKKLIAVKAINPRDFVHDKHHVVDDRPYGGGPGMVLKAEPILKAVEEALGKRRQAIPTSPRSGESGPRPEGVGADDRRIFIGIMSPRGKQFDDAQARKMAKAYDHIVLISGRYEGVDARVKKILKAKDISVGPYVLTGGELPALSVLDAVARHIPGVLGDSNSLEHTRTAAEDTYTRPETFTYKKKKYAVPSILLSGHHAAVESWRGKSSSKKKGGVQRLIPRTKSDN